MRNLVLLCCTTVLVLCSCGNELVSLNDCATKDSEINVEFLNNEDSWFVIKVTKDGRSWEYKKPNHQLTVCYYDVNFDGYNDVIFRNGDGGQVLIWSNDDNSFVVQNKDDFWGLSTPVFSPSEKAVYTGSIEQAWAKYDKNVWKNGNFRSENHLIEILSKDDLDYIYGHDFINSRYSIAHYDVDAKKYVEDFSCEEFTKLPTEWQEAVTKMKSDYDFNGKHDKLVQSRIKKRQQEDSIAAAKEAEMKRAEEMAYKLYPTGCDDVWIDMGILSDKGETLYWATSDLIIRKDKTFGLSDFGTFGYLFGWGDIAGTTKSSDLAEYGGTNPPSSISGNPQYDIAAAHLNAPARLPTKTEWMKLCENCTYKFLSIDKGDFTIGEGGLPSWVQGQWMTETRIPQIGGDALVSLSVKIAGALCSVIVTHGGQVLPIYDGVYDYSKNEDGTGELLMGKFRLLVNEKGGIIVTESGYRLRKISNEGSKQYGLLLISKINGNRLFFPLPDAHQVVRDGNYAFEFQSSQENGYWSGTTHEENNKEAWGFNVKGSHPVNFGLGFETRDTKKSVRPVTTTPVTVTIGTTKINEGENEEE